MNDIFVHYGSSKLDRSKFKEITNETYCGGLKPLGGLWGSNDNGYRWKEWCKDNNYNTERLKDSFRFRVKDGYRVLNVRNTELSSYCISELSCFEIIVQTIDWNRVKRDWDAVYIEAGSNIELYHRYYGWDCDSILVLNFDAIEEVE